MLPVDSAARTVYILTFGASIMSIFCIIIFIFLINYVQTSLPKHLKIYLTISGVGLLLMPIGNSFFCIGLAETSLTLSEPWNFINSRIIMTTGGHIARFIVLGMIFERLLATVKWKIYERNEQIRRIIGYSFGFGVTIISFVVAFLTNVTNMHLDSKLVIIDIIHGVTVVVRFCKL